MKLTLLVSDESGTVVDQLAVHVERANDIDRVVGVGLNECDGCGAYCALPFITEVAGARLHCPECVKGGAS